MGHFRGGRVKPAPFQRKSITLGEKNKEWREIPVSELELGAIVPGIGLVERITEDTFDYTMLHLHGPEASMFVYKDQKILAFQ